MDKDTIAKRRKKDLEASGYKSEIVRRKKKPIGLTKRRALYGYIFILPFIVGFLFFMIKPLLQSLNMSFSEVLFVERQENSDVNKARFSETIKVLKEFSNLENPNIKVKAPELFFEDVLVKVKQDNEITTSGLYPLAAYADEIDDYFSMLSEDSEEDEEYEDDEELEEDVDDDYSFVLNCYTKIDKTEEDSDWEEWSDKYPGLQRQDEDSGEIVPQSLYLIKETLISDDLEHLASIFEELEYSEEEFNLSKENYRENEIDTPLLIKPANTTYQKLYDAGGVVKAADILYPAGDKKKSGTLIVYERNRMYHYKRALTIDPEFNSMLVSSVAQMFYRSIATIVFSFFVALLLNQKFKGRAAARSVFFLTVILSSGVLVGIEYSNTLMAQLKASIEEAGNSNTITDVLEKILVSNAGGVNGVSGRLFKKLFEIIDSIYEVAMASGIQIIIFLSGLQNISPSMYEAAQMEGCTSWESLWKITVPMVSPLLIVCWVYTIVDFFMKTDNQIMKKISDQMTLQMNYGYSSALAWLYFLVCILLIGISSLIISKVVYDYE